MKLKLERPIAFFDLETTGVDRENDRIVEIANLSHQDFKGLLLIHSVTTLLSAMDELKGTVLYSSKVAAALDNFSETKLRKVFKNGAVDEAAKGAVVFEKMIYAVTCIQEQLPEWSRREVIPQIIE